MSAYQDGLTALADETRRGIFERLLGGPRTVGELARDLPVSRPAVSQHLGVLKRAGLVRDEPVGTRRVYSVEADGVRRLRAAIEGYWEAALDQYRRTAEEDDE